MNGYWLTLWAVSGIVAHIIGSIRLGRWEDGTSQWRHPLNYAMFIPAMLFGPMSFYILTRNK